MARAPRVSAGPAATAARAGMLTEPQREAVQRAQDAAVLDAAAFVQLTKMHDAIAVLEQSLPVLRELGVGVGVLHAGQSRLDMLDDLVAAVGRHVDRELLPRAARISHETTDVREPDKVFRSAIDAALARTLAEAGLDVAARARVLAALTSCPGDDPDTVRKRTHRAATSEQERATRLQRELEARADDAEVSIRHRWKIDDDDQSELAKAKRACRDAEIADVRAQLLGER